MTDPVEKSLVVPMTPAEAFALFTERMAEWWPLDTHSLAAQRQGVAATGVTVEPRTGGRVYETQADGSTADWATITDWRPGARLAMDWYVGRDPSEATRVAVTFLPDDRGTRVDLVHDGFDRLGAAGATRAEGYRTGWDQVLGACYGGLARRYGRAA